MKTTATHLCLMLAALTAGMTLAPVRAQQGPQIPSVRGSLDAITVLPTTQPAATQAATLPSGHPQMPAGDDAMASMHTGMAGAKSGAVRVNVSQGTKGAPPIGRDAARVDLLSKGVVIKSYQTQVDAKGIIELHDLPLDVAFQPVFTVIHGGAEQQMVGVSMNKYQPAVEFDMPVYETTADKPEWTIGLRTVEAEALPAGPGGKESAVRLTDMIGAYNPADRAWIGEPVGDSRQILAITLPPGATNVQYGPGMAEAGARVVSGKVVRGKTMLPGSTQYVFACDVPVRDGKATVSFVAPADTTLFALYVPGDWTISKATGLELGSASGAHAAGKAQLLKAKNIKAGAVLSVELGGVKAVAPAATQSQETEHGTDLHLPKPPANK